MINGQPDETDHKILNLLQQDGQMDAARVAALVHKSESHVRGRICRLQETGYIKAFAAVLEREKIGFPILVITHVKLEKQTTQLLSEFEQLAVSMNEASYASMSPATGTSSSTSPPAPRRPVSSFSWKRSTASPTPPPLPTAASS